MTRYVTPRASAAGAALALMEITGARTWREVDTSQFDDELIQEIEHDADPVVLDLLRYPQPTVNPETNRKSMLPGCTVAVCTECGGLHIATITKAATKTGTVRAKSVPKGCEVTTGCDGSLEVALPDFTKLHNGVDDARS